MASESRDRVELLQGTLDLIVLRALETMGPQHAYGLAARLEQVARAVAHPEPGHAVPRPRPAGAEGLDQGGLAADGDEPRGQVLQPHPGGRARRAGADRALAAAGRPRREAPARTSPEGEEERCRLSGGSCLRLRDFLRPGRAEPDLAREVASHLALLEDEFVRRGLGAEEARRAATRAFGGVEQAKERPSGRAVLRLAGRRAARL